MTHVYGFSSLSLLAIVTVAVINPPTPGVNAIWKVVLPPAATWVAGWRVMKALAMVPLSITNGELLKVRSPLPVLRMVKVRVSVLPTVRVPKSV